MVPQRVINTRRSREGVEDFVEGRGINASTISRHMVRATAQKVEEPFSRSLRSLAELDVAVLMIDGVDVAGHTVLTALGIIDKGSLDVKDGSEPLMSL